MTPYLYHRTYGSSSTTGHLRWDNSPASRDGTALAWRPGAVPAGSGVQSGHTRRRNPRLSSPSRSATIPSESNKNPPTVRCHGTSPVQASSGPNHGVKMVGGELGDVAVGVVSLEGVCASTIGPGFVARCGLF